ncbi:U4/U6 small nuclear ribonucleoprotein prp4 [Elasticomyces elasticus]|nr:U4/U6 small nuclear ribonucleoprotein prp4 [Elasticomyces elasticus]
MSGQVAPQHYGQWNQQRGQRRRQNSEIQYRNGQGEDGRYHGNSSATPTSRSAHGGRYNSGNQFRNAHGDDGRYHGNSQNTLTSRGGHNGRPHHHDDNIRQTQPQDNSTSRRANSATPPAGSNDILSKRNEDTNMQEQSKEKSPSPDPPAVDEKAERENRRLRLDAIRAKHMANVQLGASPLLVQALQSNNASQATSPQAESSIAPQDCSVPDSPSAASPATPLQDTAPVSPAAFKDEDLVKHNVETDAETVCAGEPSAADYDPMMDMEDDRMRMAQRQQVNEASTTAHNGTKMQAQEAIVPPASKEQNDKPRPAKDFDMFADDDDDDMFASESGKTGNDDMPKPVGRELDKSLLDNWDDPEGYYRIIIGELFESRYHVQAILGKGTYASVVRATDTKTLLADGKTHKQVAIKIIRNNDMMRASGMKEISILQRLLAGDPDDKRHMVRIERHFNHKGHLCIVFENLDVNLRDTLKTYGRQSGISIKAVRRYAQQMFYGLTLLKKCNIVHGDLKPDNILVTADKANLKICDLGSATDTSEIEMDTYLASRFYRAPEVIIGMPRTFAVDMWSIGCTLFELATGHILFTGSSNNQMLRAIMECRGKLTKGLINNASPIEMNKHFDYLNNLLSQEKDNLGKDVTRVRTITKPLAGREIRSRLYASIKDPTPEDRKDLDLLSDLLDQCLRLDPVKRITPPDALRHPFIHRGIKPMAFPPQ